MDNISTTDKSDAHKIAAPRLVKEAHSQPMKYEILCKICKKIYTKKVSYDRHNEKYHSEQNIIYTCPICLYDINNYTLYRNHCYRHLIKNRYKCNLCDKGFSQESSLQEHYKVFHENPYSCDKCKKIFLTISGLKIHSFHHHSDIEVKYTCKECGKELCSPNGLTMHLATHKLGHKFMCDFCGKQFTQKINLKTHINRFHVEKQFACKICQKKFYSAEMLDLHQIAHSDIRNYKCSICDKSFKTKRYLNIHFSKHNGGKKYVCNFCDKIFSHHQHLKQHIYLHTGEKPYACQYCTSRFRNCSNWLKHTRRVHKVDSKIRNIAPSDNIICDKPSLNEEHKENVNDSMKPRKSENAILKANSEGNDFLNSTSGLILHRNNITEIKTKIAFENQCEFEQKEVNENTYSLSIPDVDCFLPVTEHCIVYKMSDIFTSESIQNLFIDRENNTDRIRLSNDLQEQNLELSDSYVREQMNGCEITNFIQDNTTIQSSIIGINKTKKKELDDLPEDVLSFIVQYQDQSQSASESLIAPNEIYIEKNDIISTCLISNEINSFQI